MGWVAARAVCDQMQVCLLESGVADVEIIGCGEFHNSLTFLVTGTESMSTMGIAEHTGKSDNMDIPVSNWDKYLSRWNLGNSVLLLVIEMFLFRFRPNWGVYTDRKVKTVLLMISLRRMILSQFCWTLTHWGRDKMAAVSQTTLSKAFSWMKMLEFGLRFHWSLFPRVKLTIFQHWFR